MVVFSLCEKSLMQILYILLWVIICVCLYGIKVNKKCFVVNVYSKCDLVAK